MRPNYKLTVTSCFIGYVVLAIVNNFVPLLFVTLQSEYGVSLSQITLLVTVNFSIQLLSTLFFSFAGIENWRVLALIRAARLCSLCWR